MNPSGQGLREGARSYALIVVADDGNGGIARKRVTVNAADGIGLVNSYDRLTLDYNKGSGRRQHELGVWGCCCV